MYYKVIKNKKVIDVLDKLQFCKFQLKHKILLMCDESEAEGILSSDGTTAYHLHSLIPFPVDIYDNVSIEEISAREYDQLKLYNLISPEEMAERIVMELIERGAL